ncbi:MAG: RluA family pseudouridine synthase [Clostridia bacterium]|nr:RluA family pseudouridine synthase [Clostridia bacterium]
MKEFSSSGGSVSEELKNHYKSEISFVKIKQLLRGKDVKLNGKRINKDLNTEKGDIITVYYDGDKKDIKVLYKDENILAAYKEKGESYEEFAERVKRGYPLSEPCHRLDTNTDGVMLFSLNEIARAELFEAFKKRTIKKFYTAEVYGRPPKREDVLTAYLFKDAKKGIADISPTPKKGYLKIVTAYKTVEERDGSTVLEVELLTGRTHQIRAHLAFIGNFIIGDGKYGKESVNRKFKAKTQRLTAKKIIFSFKEGDSLYYLNGKEIGL